MRISVLGPLRLDGVSTDLGRRDRVVLSAWRCAPVFRSPTTASSSLSGGMPAASEQVVWADRGIIYTHVLVDTEGDDDPENDVYDVTNDWERATLPQ